NENENENEDELIFPRGSELHGAIGEGRYSLMEHSKNKRPSIADVARAAEVSTYTVTAALTGKGRVGAATRQRVQDAATRLGYEPNLLARALRTKRTGIIGAVFPSLYNIGIDELLRGADQVAVEKSYSILTANSHNRPEIERRLSDVLQYASDGLMVHTRFRGANADFYRQLARQMPMVTILNKMLAPEIDSVEVDDTQIGEQACHHLLDCGRRRLVCLAPADSIEMGWGEMRLAGFALSANGAGLGPVARLTAPRIGKEPLDVWAERVLQASLAAGECYDGIFAVNDVAAVGVMHAMQAHGLRIPEDVAVIGCDNSPFLTELPCPLTTFQQPLAEVGRTAMRLLLQRLEAPKEHIPAAHERLPARLIIRASTQLDHAGSTVLAR
ncbi:MAG TPA: LacI family DNA-binding transcriptional regulator, partial [Armatimonadota bacterium]